jgi:hypothetical protein
MFCPKCGTTIEEGINVCPTCGLDITTIDQGSKPEISPAATTPATASSGSTNKADNQIIRYVYFGLAAVVLIMFFIAASSIVSGGNEIMQIQSVGGKTLEEAYYYELGSIYAGYAMISRALGIFFASVLVWLGLKN